MLDLFSKFASVFLIIVQINPQQRADVIGYTFEQGAPFGWAPFNGVGGAMSYPARLIRQSKAWQQLNQAFVQFEQHPVMNLRMPQASRAQKGAY